MKKITGIGILLFFLIACASPQEPLDVQEQKDIQETTTPPQEAQEPQRIEEVSIPAQEEVEEPLPTEDTPEESKEGETQEEEQDISGITTDNELNTLKAELTTINEVRTALDSNAEVMITIN